MTHRDRRNATEDAAYDLAARCGRQRDELVAALEVVKPFALRWHDRIMSFLVEEAVNTCERLEDKQIAWKLYRHFEEERRNIKETIEAALASASGGEAEK